MDFDNIKNERKEHCMRIFIIGAEESGKSTASRFLSLELGIPAEETGRVVMRELAKYHVKQGDTYPDVEVVAATIELCKDQFREHLRMMGTMMTKLKPTALIDGCTHPYKPAIVVGVRRMREVQGLMLQDERHLADAVWIRIDRPGHDRKPGDVYELDDLPCEYVVRNCASLKCLRERMIQIAGSLRQDFAANGISFQSKAA
jgi:hypothetical protein